MSLHEFMRTKQEEIEDVISGNGVIYVMSDYADQFVTAFESLQTALDAYRESTDLDAAFFTRV
jgi:hypothetical protein